MFRSLPKSKYPTGMLYFLTEHTLIIFVQYIKGSKRKTSYLLEKMFEKDLVPFVSDSIFKRLKFNYSSSQTVSNQKIKIKKCFRDDCVFLVIRLTHWNQLLPNMTRNKWETAFSNLFKWTWDKSCINTNKKPRYLCLGFFGTCSRIWSEINLKDDKTPFFILYLVLVQLCIPGITSYNLRNVQNQFYWFSTLK